MTRTPQLNGLTALGASNAIGIRPTVLEYTFETWLTQNAIEANKITALTIKIQGSLLDDGALGIVTPAGPVLAIGSTPERVANSAFTYRIADVNYNKGAVSAGSVFSSNHVVTASKFGVINLYIDAAQAIVTLSTQLGQDQTTALASDDAAAAITVAGEIPIPANHVYLGYVLIEDDGTGWTANTDNLSTEVTSATFTSASPAYDDILTHSYSAEELTQLRASFGLVNRWYKYMRFFVSAITGTGKVYGQMESIMRLRG